VGETVFVLGERATLHFDAVRGGSSWACTTAAWTTTTASSRVTIEAERRG
jgi:hypothetical protein